MSAHEAVGFKVGQQGICLSLGDGASCQGIVDGLFISRGHAGFEGIRVAQRLLSQDQVSLFLSQVAGCHSICDGGRARRGGCSLEFIGADAQGFRQQSLEVDITGAHKTAQMHAKEACPALFNEVSLGLGNQICCHGLFQRLIGSSLIGGLQLVHSDTQRFCQTLLRDAITTASAFHHAIHASDRSRIGANGFDRADAEENACHQYSCSQEGKPYFFTHKCSPCLYV